jgi:hypothetical protein
MVRSLQADHSLEVLKCLASCLGTTVSHRQQLGLGESVLWLWLQFHLLYLFCAVIPGDD